MRQMLVAIFFLTSCVAHAKPKLPEFVAYEDAEDSLKAQAELQAAVNNLTVKQVKWQRARARLIEIYGIDPDQGHGWDPTPDGKLKARRESPQK